MRGVLKKIITVWKSLLLQIYGDSDEKCTNHEQRFICRGYIAHIYRRSYDNAGLCRCGRRGM
jgi:hypothetical protein